jgi:hypothetical protein
MDAMAPEIWRAVGASLALIFRGAPGFESRLTPTAVGRCERMRISSGKPLYNDAE